MDDTRIPHRAEPGQKELDAVDARSGTEEGVTRYVLAAGTLLVIVLFAIIYKVFF
jgi:hypothetical protein